MIDSQQTNDVAVREHFRKRSASYNRSSRWVCDTALAEAVLQWLQIQPEDRVLDVACGTGLWAEAFHKRVAYVVGVDFTPAMYRQARGRLDDLVHAAGGCLPFLDDVFDVVIERQGIQFMNAQEAVREMVRVAKPGGRVTLVQLCARGPEDRDEFFEILRLRNPARRNFFMREDLSSLLRQAGCAEVSMHEYVTTENTDAWSDNGAIDDGRRAMIRACYRSASPAFRKLHRLELTDGVYVDRMLMCVAIGTKPVE